MNGCANVKAFTEFEPLKLQPVLSKYIFLAGKPNPSVPLEPDVPLVPSNPEPLLEPAAIQLYYPVIPE